MRLKALFIAGIFVASILGIQFTADAQQEREQPQGSEYSNPAGESGQLRNFDDILNKEFSFEQRSEMENQINQKLDAYDSEIQNLQQKTRSLERARNTLENQLIKINSANQEEWQQVSGEVEENIESISKNERWWEFWK